MLSPGSESGLITHDSQLKRKKEEKKNNSSVACSYSVRVNLNVLVTLVTGEIPVMNLPEESILC